MGWRKGPAGTSSSSTSAKSCPGGGTSPGTGTGWGHPAGEQLGREGPGGHQAEHEQRLPRVSWAASGGAWPAGRGRGSATERPGAVQPGDETARGDLIHVHRYLQGGCREDRARLFPVVSRGHGPTLEHRRVPLNIRKPLFPGRVPQPRHRLPREVVESPSLELLTTLWTRSWATGSGGFAPDGAQRCLQPQQSAPVSAPTLSRCLPPRAGAAPGPGPRGGSEAPSPAQAPAHPWPCP